MRESVLSFIAYARAEKGFSSNTISAYLNDLTQLQEFVASMELPEGAERGPLSRDQIMRFLLSLREKQYAPTTIARKVAAVKSFCHFLEQEGLLTQDPTGLDAPIAASGAMAAAWPAIVTSAPALPAQAPLGAT